MITEDYVSFETAKLLKEKGLDKACNRVYQGHTLTPEEMDEALSSFDYNPFDDFRKSDIEVE
jgi:hypothetical protein